MTRPPHVYVTDWRGAILHRAGRGERAVAAALEWAIRRYALANWLAVRAGFAPNVSVPMAVWARAGRPLAVGAAIGGIGPSRWRTLAGTRASRAPVEAAEIARPLPGACVAARDALRGRHPKAWARHERYPA